MRAISQALRYSGGVPLTFSLGFQDITSRSHKVVSCYLDMFIAQAARWRNVTLHLERRYKNLPLIKNRLPMLESLVLFLDTYTYTTSKLPVPTDIFSNAPNLRNVTLTICSPEFIFPWKQLKEFSVLRDCGLSLGYYLQILCNGTLLETLRLRVNF
ncbi:hypothetical protein IW262DRAFT_665761 [Armillaria fumosa]|nr:hypothetical protein IW262DRAFT_665761 [Armillaria fumosa]